MATYKDTVTILGTATGTEWRETFPDTFRTDDYYDNSVKVSFRECDNRWVISSTFGEVYHADTLGEVADIVRGLAIR